MAQARYEFDEERRDMLLSAASWVHAFQPRIEVVLDEDAVALRADTLSGEALDLIWNSAVANERLCRDAAAARAAAREALDR